MARPSNQAVAVRSPTGRSPMNGWGIDSIALDPRGTLTPMLNTFGLMEEMRRFWLTDETAGAMRWCIMTALKKLQWRFTPQIDGEDAKTDPDAMKFAAFANSILVDMDAPMSEHVENAMAMIWAGFSPCEIVMKQRDGLASRFDDNLWGIDSLPIRDPRTVTSWTYDDRQRLAGMNQSGAQGTIPYWKLLHYRTTTELNLPNGIPLLLPARRAWLLKNKIQDSEAIGIERDLVGLPVFRIPRAIAEQANEKVGGNFTDAAKEAQTAILNAQSAVKDLRFNKSGGLVIWSDTFADDVQGDFTPQWDFKIVTTGGQRSIDTRTAARDYDRAISRVLSMQFLQLGDRSTGSYALSDDQSSMAYSSLMALALIVADQFNLKAIPLAWMVNGLPKKYLPKMEPGEISKQSLAALGALLQGIGKSEPLWGNDPKLRNALIGLTNLESDPHAQDEAAATSQEAANTAAKAPPVGGAAGTQGSSDENPQDA